ncbi:protein of unknown function [Paraburkholderia kururiensis]
MPFDQYVVEVVVGIFRARSAMSRLSHWQAMKPDELSFSEISFNTEHAAIKQLSHFIFSLIRRRDNSTKIAPQVIITISL